MMHPFMAVMASFGLVVAAVMGCLVFSAAGGLVVLVGSAVVVAACMVRLVRYLMPTYSDPVPRAVAREIIR